MLICCGIVYERKFIINKKEGRIVSNKEATYNMFHIESPHLRFLGVKSQVKSFFNFPLYNIFQSWKYRRWQSFRNGIFSQDNLGSFFFSFLNYSVCPLDLQFGSALESGIWAHDFWDFWVFLAIAFYYYYYYYYWVIDKQRRVETQPEASFLQTRFQRIGTLALLLKKCAKGEQKVSKTLPVCYR